MGGIRYLGRFTDSVGEVEAGDDATIIQRISVREEYPIFACHCAPTCFAATPYTGKLHTANILEACASLGQRPASPHTASARQSRPDEPRPRSNSPVPWPRSMYCMTAPLDGQDDGQDDGQGGRCFGQVH